MSFLHPLRDAVPFRPGHPAIHSNVPELPRREALRCAAFRQGIRIVRVQSFRMSFH
jgi:hypothetical protein